MRVKFRVWGRLCFVCTDADCYRCGFGSLDLGALRFEVKGLMLSKGLEIRAYVSESH